MLKISQVQDQVMTLTNEVTVKTTGIQQQLIVQSNDLSNIIQAISQLKILMIEKPCPLQQSQPIQQQSTVQQSNLQQQTPSTQGITVNGSSSLIDSSHFGKLKEWIPNANNAQNCRLDLLYKGSRYGFSNSTFHQKCDQKRPTITFIKSQTYGRVFGGYTEQTWDQNPPTAHCKSDDKAFLFSLTHNEQYSVVQPQYAVVANPIYLCSFGCNPHDICIYDNCNTVTTNYASFPGSYQCAQFGSIKTNESTAYLAGHENFKVEEIEVYQIIWT